MRETLDKFTAIRMAKTMHAGLKAYADDRGISMNCLMRLFLQRGLDETIGDYQRIIKGQEVLNIKLNKVLTRLGE